MEAKTVFPPSSISVAPMKIPAPLAIRRGAPAWAPAARAATQGRPYNWPGTPTAIFIGCGEPQDHGNSVAILSFHGRDARATRNLVPTK